MRLSRGSMRILALIGLTLVASAWMAWEVSGSVNSSRTASLQIAQAGVQRSEQQLAAAVFGECTGRNTLIGLIDATHMALHRAFVEAALLIPRANPQLRRLASDYLADSRAVKGITIVNCAQQIAHPLTYKQPGATPFPGAR